MSASLSEFELMLLHSGNEVGTSVLLILAWIAASDGTIDESESAQLEDIAESSGYGQDIHHIISLAKRRNLDALQLAAEIVRDEFDGDKAGQFLTMAMGTAMADGTLATFENHILRFLADLLGCSHEALNRIARDITGNDMPVPDDLSTAEYWKDHPEEAAPKVRQRTPDPDAATKAPATPANQQAIESYAALGLPVGANREQITAAYSRLTKIHHPDRFADLGDESQAAATATFNRIKAAYDYLVRYA